MEPVAQGFEEYEKGDNTQQQYKHTELKLYFVHPDLHNTSLLAYKQGMN